MNRYAWSAVIIMIALAFTMIVVAMQPSRVRPPVIEWLGDSYAPVTGCPGDEVSYSLRLRVGDPSILFVATAHLRAGDAGDTIQGALLGETFMTVIPTARTLVDNDVSWTIPDFPPGEYVRVVAAGTFSESSEPAMRQQPYTIREDCP